MKSLLLLLGLLMFTMSCTPDPNPSEFKLVTAKALTSFTTKAIVTTFSCSEVALVNSDVEAKVNQWFGIQKVNDKGIVSALCSTAVKAVLPMLIQQGTAMITKPEWKCTGKAAADSITTVASLACSMIPLSESK